MIFWKINKPGLRPSPLTPVPMKINVFLIYHERELFFKIKGFIRTTMLILSS
jgi:hypothetical protein